MSREIKYDVLIIGGLGHVGLPLGIVMAEVGLQVALYDLDTAKRALVEAGRMPFLEHDAEPMLKRVLGKTLHLVDSLAAARQSEVALITIGTPIDEYMNPNTRPLMDLAKELAPHLRRDQCVVLRSTVAPGTSHYLQQLLVSLGCHIDLAYCPERIVQGYAIRELKQLPQIISGYTDRAEATAEHLFTRLGVEVIRVSLEEAELVKLFSNAWRYTQFAVSNQFYMLAKERGADFDRIHHAMTHNYSRARDFPRPGFAAGPCLLKDTLQLTAGFGGRFHLGLTTMTINEGLPNFLVEMIKRDLQVDLAGKHIGILGMSFKADTDDIRDSLSYKLAKILRFQGAEVVCSDEYVQDPSFVSKEDILTKCSIVIIGVPHRAYQGLKALPNTYVVDLWGVIGGISRNRNDTKSIPVRIGSGAATTQTRNQP